MPAHAPVPALPVPARAAGIALGVLADLLLGDPRRAHPVAFFGRWAGRLERAVYAPTRARGAGYAAFAVAGPVLLGLAAERVTAHRPVARVLVTALATWTALGGTSLYREAAMADALEAGDLAAGRDRLTHLCARDPAGLPAAGLARATVESMAENTSDAVVAPLLWAAVAGVPGVLGYRAINTLDAMVGYRSPRYREFGWAGARLDDVVNLAPARLTGVLTVGCARPVVGGSTVRAWQVWRADARAHPSPNAGHCEASAAGALGVVLGGTNSYAGRAESRPAVGAPGRAPEVADVRRAARLGRAVGLAGAIVAVGLATALPGATRALRGRQPTASARAESGPPSPGVSVPEPEPEPEPEPGPEPELEPGPEPEALPGSAAVVGSPAP